MNFKGLIMALGGATALSLGEAQQLPTGWSEVATRDAARVCRTSAGSPWSLGDNYLQIACRQRTDGTIAITQSVSAAAFRHRRMQLSAELKSEVLRGKAGLLMRVEADDLTILALDDMGTRSIRGNTEWTEHRILLDVDAAAATVTFGLQVEDGPGTLLARNIRFEEAPADSSELSIRLLPTRRSLPSQPQNLELR